MSTLFKTAIESRHGFVPRSTAVSPVRIPAVEDPLAYLPQKRVEEYAKQQIIYSPGTPCHRLYLVTSGRVTVSGVTGEGQQAVTRILGQGGLFGESALVVPGDRQELAVALDKTGLMSWTRDEVDAQIERDPRLGLAMAQYLARECVRLNVRIESMVIHKTPERVMLALIDLANSLGTPKEDGAMRMPHLTHQTIAQYVGTSREIVTFQMTRLRKLKLLKYNRSFADVYTGAMAEMLRAQGVTVSRAGGLASTADQTIV
jgi:CRP-like cAMP-binding protein